MLSQHYPPMPGGISVYAEEHATALREEGHEVEVAATAPSRADHVVDIGRRGGGRSLARLARRHDRLVVQFQPEILGDPGASRLSRAFALARLARGLKAAPSSELRIHEVDYGLGVWGAILRHAVRPVWRMADLLTVHTERERQDFIRAFGTAPERVRVASQGGFLRKRIALDRAAARASLGLPAGAKLLLAMGFLHPNKGFDRAVRAFGRLQPEGARLYIVGSLWREDEVSRDHLAALRELIAETPGTELREGYLDDEEFDAWIVASDAMVLPYRKGWSSAVMERGLLYGRPVIMSRMGGMAEQGSDRPEAILVDDDEGLLEALRRLLSEATREPPAALGEPRLAD